MNLTTKRYIVGALAFFFLLSLLLVAYNESTRQKVERKETPVVTRRPAVAWPATASTRRRW